MITSIAPIAKNKAGDLSDNNCRTIALVIIASKLFEYMILSRVSTFLTTCVNQFGFKSITQLKCSYSALYSERLIYVCHYVRCL